VGAGACPAPIARRRLRKVKRMPQGLKWYATTLLFESKVGGIESIRPLCEERIVLFRGASDAAVVAMAQRYGKQEEHSYRNNKGDNVQWRFARVDRVEEVEDPAPRAGWEVGSRFVRRHRTKVQRD
jgi:hypothetical protein